MLCWIVPEVPVTVAVYVCDDCWVPIAMFTCSMRIASRTGVPFVVVRDAASSPVAYRNQRESPSVGILSGILHPAARHRLAPRPAAHGNRAHAS